MIKRIEWLVWFTKIKGNATFRKEGSFTVILQLPQQTEGPDNEKVGRWFGERFGLNFQYKAIVWTMIKLIKWFFWFMNNQGNH